MKTLEIDRSEAEEVFNSDMAIERKESQDFDLPLEKQKVAQKFAHTGTRNSGYNFNKRERKPNATKGGLIAELAELLANGSQFSVENLKIVNKERQISFSIGDDNFEIVLTQKRKPKK